MEHERRRAALAALCVFAIVLAASLFPASGFGSYPAGVGTGGSPETTASDGAVFDEPVQTPPTETTSSDDRTTTETTQTTIETTRTTETTETTTATGSSDAGGTSGVALVLVWSVFSVVGAVLAFGFWSGVLAVSTAAAAGPLPFTITVDGTPIGELAGSIPTRTMGLVVGFSGAVPRLLDDATTLSREAGSSLSNVLGSVARGTGDALRIGGRGLAATFAAVPRALAGLGAGMSVFSGLGRSVSVPSIGRKSRSDGSNRSTADAEPEETAPPSVEDAWQAMSETVPVSNRSARTPGEIARNALDRGYPDEAVRRLTDAFREVRYGGLPRSGRTDAARAALDRLRNYWGDEK